MTLGVLQAMSVIVALTLTLSMSPFVEAMKGGEWANPGEFPYAVQLSLSKTGEIFCGGSIFSPNVVITAAHCVYSHWEDYWKSVMLHRLWFPNEYVWVTAGSLENREMKGFKESGDGMAQVRAVDLFAIHPDFNSSSYENDIALLILGEPLNFTDNVKAIQLPPANETYSRGTLLGWGYTYRGNISTPYLKKMEVVFEDRDSCNSDPLIMESKGRKVTDLELCTKWKKGTSACRCDIGSSVICQGSNATLHNNGTSNSSLSPTICGIVTFGIGGGTGCAETDNIGVFVDVSKYLDWIQKEAERNVDYMKTDKLLENVHFFVNCVFDSIFIVYLVLLVLTVCILIVVGVGFLFIWCFSKIKKTCFSRATSESQVA